MSNKEVAEWCGITAEWIEERTEILTRRYAAPDEATSDLAAHALTSALRSAGITADRLDYLIVSTSTGDSPQPPTANLVQHAVGATGAACFDVNVVCSGFVFGLEMAHRLLPPPVPTATPPSSAPTSTPASSTTPTTAPPCSSATARAPRSSAPSATGTATSAPSWPARGDAHRLIRVEAGGSRIPTTPQTLADGGHYFRMEGRGVRDFVMDHVPPVLDRLLRGAGLTAADVDHFVPHQPNGVLLRGLVDKIGMSHAHTHRTLEKYGNVGSASVPVALDDGCRSGLIRDGDLVVMAGFGGGMSVGATLMRWQERSRPGQT
ncbi:ketoacyl-ACP synthase III [Streptomyces goshikiensis]